MDRNKISEAYIFDIDGVITDPVTKDFDKEIMTDLIQRLNVGDPVILNTGRSIAWVINNVVSKLENSHKVKEEVFQNLFVVGEKGGTWITFDNKAAMHEHIDKLISMPEKLKSEIKDLVNKQFSKTMFFDETKKTMITIEMQNPEKNITLAEYQTNQHEILSMLNQMIKGSEYSSLEIETSTIAIDIQHEFVGKDYATNKSLSWLKDKDYTVEKFVAVGDSLPDIEMAEELVRNKQTVEFVFVGDKEDRKILEKKDFPFQIHYTHKLYSRGTAEFLQRE